MFVLIVTKTVAAKKVKESDFSNYKRQKVCKEQNPKLMKNNKVIVIISLLLHNNVC